eukprot:scaffold27877_cov63-Phaeocystis_antarctica.AAC.4
MRPRSIASRRHRRASASGCPFSSEAVPTRCSTPCLLWRPPRPQAAPRTWRRWRRPPSRSCRPSTLRGASCAAGSATARAMPTRLRLRF